MKHYKKKITHTVSNAWLNTCVWAWSVVRIKLHL